jgi:predicted permease
MLRDLFGDVRYGCRLIRKHPVLSALTVLTFTLGLGLNAGVFTVIDGLLFRPRVAHDPASFVQLDEEIADANGRTPRESLVSLHDFTAFARAASLADLSAFTPVHATVGNGQGRARQIPLLVSCNFFATYGPDRPLLGRLLQPEDCSRSDAPPIAVIGEDLWRTTMAADPRVIGTTLLLNQRPFTIVGVMSSGYAGQLRGPIWIPFTAARLFFDGRDLFREPETPWLLGIVGRLQPGASRASAAAELSVIARRLDRTAPSRRRTVRVTDGAMINQPVVQAAAGWIVPLIMAAPSLVLLIACANVAVLLLSRSAARHHEIAVRIALGASRSRMLRMLVVESAVLAAIAAPPSLVLAYAAPKIFRVLIPALPYYPFAIDGTVLAYLAATGVVAVVAASIAPAIESLKKDVKSALQRDDAVPGAIGWHARDVLMAAQVGLSLVLLFAAGMFLHAEWRLLAASPGYELERVMVVVPQVNVPPHTPQTARSFYQRFIDRVLAIPGVRTTAYERIAVDDSASFAQTGTMVAPLTGVNTVPTIAVVSSQYFRTLQIPIVAGTVFGDNAESARTVVVSESLARVLWPGRAPLGQVAQLGNTEVTIAAVVHDVQSASSGTGERTVYVPSGPVRAGDAIYVAFDGGEAETALAIRDAISALDANATAQPQTLGSIRRDQAAKFMPIVEMVLGLGALALALGVAGIYGVVAFTVGRRMREMGIRIALGARRADVIRLVLSSGAARIGVGFAGGGILMILGSRTLARIFTNTPVHIDVWDPLVYAGVTALLTITAVIAMLGPARRAASADPVNALRCD